MKYRAIFERAPHGGWLADIPEVPGCSVSGQTIAEARERAKPQQKPAVLDRIVTGNLLSPCQLRGARANQGSRCRALAGFQCRLMLSRALVAVPMTPKCWRAPCCASSTFATPVGRLSRTRSHPSPQT
jgi:hypothetical protein